MKTIVQIFKINILLTALLAGFIAKSQNTKQSGDWQIIQTWEGNLNVPIIIRNNYGFNKISVANATHNVSIGTVGVKKDLNIDKSGFILEVKGTLTIYGSLLADNNLIINVLPMGKLIIKQNLDVENNLTINVSEGGQLIVDKNILIKNNAGIVVNGDLSADRIEGKNSNEISGTGNIYVNSITGVRITNFKGKIVGGTTNLFFASPNNLSAEVDGELRVKLKWSFMNSLTDESGFTFMGFQVFRNFGGPMHYDEIIFGNLINGNYPQNDKNTVFMDPFKYMPGATPRYYVRAVYKQNVKSDIYYYSALSNNVDFSNSPLPIEFIYFNAKAINNSVQLEWATATEVNNDFFTIERSMDGKWWDVVTHINGAGNTNHLTRYDFIDNNPYSGISYYRLKQTDYDGKYEYFAPVAVNNSNIKKGTEIVNVAFSAQKMEIWVKNEVPGTRLIVADLQGRIIGQFNLFTEDYVQNITVNFARSYQGEVVIVRLISNNISDERKYVIR